jgi:phosphohistidine phosphatase SixA
MNAFAVNRVRRLVDALCAVRAPLASLFEYADDLERHLTDDDEIEVECIAALLRARAVQARHELTRCLDTLEEAATCVAAAEEPLART